MVTVLLYVCIHIHVYVYVYDVASKCKNICRISFNTSPATIELPKYCDLRKITNLLLSYV